MGLYAELPGACGSALSLSSLQEAMPVGPTGGAMPQARASLVETK